MERILWIPLFVLMSASTDTMAQKHYFRHYCNEDGLSNNTIICSLQDRRGFMWFGTKDGLNRFDGHQFRTYVYNATDRNSIIDNMILALCEDREGLIWIGTPRGICYYEPHHDHFITLSGQISTGLITDIAVSSDNAIWFSGRQGVFRYNKNTRQLRHYPSYEFFTPSSIHITASGNIWVSSYNGNIYHYNPRSDSFTEYSILTDEEYTLSVFINSIEDAGPHGFLLGTTRTGLRLFDPNSGKTTVLCRKDSKGNEIILNDILKKNDEEYFLATEYGIYSYHLGKGFTGHAFKIVSDPYSLSDNAAKNLTRDREGGIWIGTYHGGINYLPQETTPFEKYYATGIPGSMGGNVVRNIIGDGSGKIWIATEDAGVIIYDPVNNLFTNLNTDLNIAGLKSVNYHGLLNDNGLLWMGSYDNGAFLYDTGRKTVTRHFILGDNTSGLRNNYVSCFLKTADGSVLVGTRTGLYAYHREKARLEYLHDVAPNTFIHVLFQDQNGIIWIGTYGSGIFCYDRKNNTCTHLYYDPRDSASISSNRITSIYEDRQNRLWFTTEGNGFCCLEDRENHRFRRFTMEDGLPCGIFCSILEDGQGNLWISSTRGLLKFNPETLQMSMYNKEHGLLSNHFSYNSAYLDHNGKMYFGTVDGLIAFNPANFCTSTYNPPVFITGIQCSGQGPENIKDIQDNTLSITHSREIRLKHNQSSFSIDFVAPSFTNPVMTRYRYILEGADQNWTYLPTNRRVYYTNVPPGKYLFRVSTQNWYNSWNEEEATLLIRITPPFYASLPAFGLYLLLFMTGTYFLYRWRERKKRQEQKQKIQVLENRKEKEILNAKINFFTNITHEVRTPLTLIKAPLDKILQSNECPDTVLENLSIMKRNTDRLLDLTTQLLDFRKTEKEVFRLNFKQTNVCELLESTFKRFKLNATESHIRFRLHLPGKKYPVFLDQENTTKILSNLLTNALKFTRDEVDVFLEPGMPDKNSLRIRVNSNGEPIPPEYSEKIFEPFFQIQSDTLKQTRKGTGLGLPLARSLAELHHGRLYLDQKVPGVNSFVLELPKNQPATAPVPEEEKWPATEMAWKKSPQEQQVNDHDPRPLILIVEDEKELCRFIAGELSEKYNTAIAFNGAEAVEILKNREVHMVVSDVVMPVMDGYELCNFIKGNLDYCHIPVILLTATINLHARIEGLESGADAYIEKPFTTELLLAQISNLFSNKELACESFMKSPLTNYKTVAINKMDKAFMKQLHGIIMKNLSEPELSVDMVAGMMGMSVSTLYRKVKALTDLNTNEYIRLYRLKKAAEMLRSNEYRVNEVSYLAGFSSSSYFATSFQKQFGMTPTEFIKKQRVRSEE